MRRKILGYIACIIFLIGVIGINYYDYINNLMNKMNDLNEILDNNKFDSSFNDVAVSKSCAGKLSEKRGKKIIGDLVQKLNGRIIDVENISNKCGLDDKKEIVRLYGYSKLIKNDRNYMGKRINFSIVVTYNQKDNITNLYLGSPVVNIDY